MAPFGAWTGNACGRCAGGVADGLAAMALAPDCGVPWASSALYASCGAHARMATAVKRFPCTPVVSLPKRAAIREGRYNVAALASVSARARWLWVGARLAPPIADLDRRRAPQPAGEAELRKCIGVCFLDRWIWGREGPGAAEFHPEMGAQGLDEHRVLPSPTFARKLGFTAPRRCGTLRVGVLATMAAGSIAFVQIRAASADFGAKSE